MLILPPVLYIYGQVGETADLLIHLTIVTQVVRGLPTLSS